MRPLVSVHLGVSLDLRIAHPDGSRDFLAPYQQPHEDYGYAAFLQDIDAIVMGRYTLDAILGFDVVWPFGDRRVVVLTNRPLPSVPVPVSAHAGPLTPLLEVLGLEHVRHVYLDGGATVRQGLREHAVDRFTLSVMPELLGAGRPLFDGTVPRSHWQLDSSVAYDTGLVQVRYRRRAHP